MIVTIAFPMSEVGALDGSAEAAVLAEMGVFVRVTNGDVLPESTRRVERLVAIVALVPETVFGVDPVLVGSLIVSVAESTLTVLTLVRLLLRVNSSHVGRQTVTFEVAQGAFPFSSGGLRIQSQVLALDVFVELLLIFGFVVTVFVRAFKSKILVGQQRVLFKTKRCAEQFTTFITCAFSDVMLSC